ncbi:NAD-dependent epimerase/dehydratase family protein, partial [candidate division KSB1 bacterium]|nr:NAD-dependent epimerase/dehydratase family protein [candidate division KSB1 bacterium]
MTPKNRTHQIFSTGGSGYMGRSLIPRLLQRGHEVRALVRAGSEQKLPAGCTPVLGNALEPRSFMDHVRPADTFVHLVGVSHPNPSKAGQFRTIDLASVQAAVPAAKAGGDLMCLAYYTSFNLPVTITRGSNNIGPYQYPEKAVPLFITNAIDNKPLPLYGDGLQMRDYQYVQD